ncbi:MAG: phosphodiester glycosidase family protein [Deltaproteobacteria bacterium]|nr:phosphodiester glycosidase family protein [Kofleriaceae bacterium]
MRRQYATATALGAALVAALAAAPDAGAATRTSATTPYPGVVHEEWSEGAIPAIVHVVRVDLTSAEITVHATREEDRGRTVSAFAAGAGAQVAINGDLFAPAGYVPDGLAMGAGRAWSQTADDAVSAVFRFGKVASRTDGLLIVPESVVALGDLPSFVTGVVGGRPMLVRAGQAVTSFDCADTGAIACVRAPRTALGLSDDNRTLWLVVVDGWQSTSVGMTAAELAAFLRDRGVRDAIALDGGGASAMVIAGEGGLVSSPSDGVERPVANHLGIAYGAQAPGTLLGKVREGSLTGPNVPGVLVRLDDGRTVTTDNMDNGYSFSVSPRFACVTASKAGYNTVTQCKQVEPGILNYNSIVMFPLGQGVDAGVVDAGIPDGGDGSIDAANGDGGGGDDGSGSDAGDGGGGGDGCCSTGARGRDPVGVASVALVVVFGVRRRRRRT